MLSVRRRRLSNILYGPQCEVAAVLDWSDRLIGDHEADLAWMLFVDWACSEYEGVPRLDGKPTREEPSIATSNCRAHSAKPALQRSARGGRARSPDLATGDQASQPEGAARRRPSTRRCLRRTNPPAPRLAAQRFRRAAVDVEVRLDHRPQGAPASPALAARATGLGDLLRRLGAVGHHVVDDVAGGSVHRQTNMVSPARRWP